MSLATAVRRVLCSSLHGLVDSNPQNRLLVKTTVGISNLNHFKRYSTIETYQEEIDNINRKFAEARDEIEFAKEDAETTYFNESCEDAKLLVDDVLLEWTTVLGKLSDDERSKLQRFMGLKIEQLKAEMEELNHLHAD